MTLLRSHLSGTWQTGSGVGRPLYDAVTGEEVARVSAEGLDLGAALAHGRRTGGPALRELTFHQRAALLKALGGHLREHREELYAVSARTGATLGDSTFDIDGGIGVLLAYASKAKRELPNDTVFVEGAVEPLGRGGSFLGLHALRRPRGAIGGGDLHPSSVTSASVTSVDGGSVRRCARRTRSRCLTSPRPAGCGRHADRGTTRH